VSTATAGFQQAYTRAFRAFLDDDAEPNLRAAYELGREAVGRSLGLLDLAQVHHEALLAELARVGDARGVQGITLAGADFMVEALSAYEMVRRGFTEARDAVASERRQARMLRQLSTLLADASLALQAHSSVGEVLQLVVEQTLELTRAPWGIASVAGGPGDSSPTVAHAGAPQPALREIAGEAFAAASLGTDPTDVAEVQARSAPAVLGAVALTALDGEPIGVLAVAESAGRPFTELDKVLLVHIGQMTSAAIERATRFHGPPGRAR
jgi:hypothetical protein